MFSSQSNIASGDNSFVEDNSVNRGKAAVVIWVQVNVASTEEFLLVYTSCIMHYVGRF